MDSLTVFSKNYAWDASAQNQLAQIQTLFDVLDRYIANEATQEPYALVRELQKIPLFDMGVETSALTFALPELLENPQKLTEYLLFRSGSDARMDSIVSALFMQTLHQANFKEALIQSVQQGLVLSRLLKNHPRFTNSYEELSAADFNSYSLLCALSVYFKDRPDTSERFSQFIQENRDSLVLTDFDAFTWYSSVRALDSVCVNCPIPKLLFVDSYQAELGAKVSNEALTATLFNALLEEGLPSRVKYPETKTSAQVFAMNKNVKDYIVESRPYFKYPFEMPEEYKEEDYISAMVLDSCFNNSVVEFYEEEIVKRVQVILDAAQKRLFNSLREPSYQMLKPEAANSFPPITRKPSRL